MKTQTIIKNLLIGMSLTLVAENLFAAMPYQSELKVIKEVACQFERYADTPEAIENLLMVELGTTLFYVQNSYIPDLGMKGLTIRTSGQTQLFDEIILIPSSPDPNLPPILSG